MAFISSVFISRQEERSTRPHTAARTHRLRMCLAASKLQRIKVCGVTTVDDAQLIIKASRLCLPPHIELLIGMIIWPKSVRSVSMSEAKEITSYAKSENAIPVGVFVDETQQDIMNACELTGLDTVQFHGPQVRSIRSSVPSSIHKINVVDVLADGSYSMEPNLDADMWTLFDAKGGGTGKAFDWSRFVNPNSIANPITKQSIKWMLAGGLGPENVNEAVLGLDPPGLDVATGVCKDGDKCRKDYNKLIRFFELALQGYQQNQQACQ